MKPGRREIEEKDNPWTSSQNNCDPLRLDKLRIVRRELRNVREQSEAE
jgi:hypothetical protein